MTEKYPIAHRWVWLIGSGCDLINSKVGVALAVLHDLVLVAMKGGMLSSCMTVVGVAWE